MPKVNKLDPLYHRRWEEDIGHHPMSEELMFFMKAIDKLEGYPLGDYLETGGDGDVGESLMYLMDPFFEQLEAKIGMKLEAYSPHRWD